ncbi:hypothetical protein BKA62DRAFT_644786 [Auriculariales sp. MPI-PUGE-AT-0066]|nr:hypothetical protein BKA62DRAFT_644786 [Auriculariales sp. MPI-PUGE-AT-0066]
MALDLAQEETFFASRRQTHGLNLDGAGHTGNHGLKTAPLFTASALRAAGTAVFPLRGLLGATTDDEDLVYFNTNAPSSGVVCGVQVRTDYPCATIPQINLQVSQGSGKSHTISCLLENALVADPRIGNLPQPLAALVFHFDEEDGDRPCEAAHLGTPAVTPNGPHVGRVTVLASSVNLVNRRQAYANLSNVNVQPLLLSEADITVQRLLTLMGWSDDAADKLPLYMHTILQIVREMGPEGFSYTRFKRRIEAEKFDATQRMMLSHRLRLLDGFVKPTSRPIRSYFAPGEMVLVDLTDPFLNGMLASVLFDIVLTSFMGWSSPTGRIVVLDEAHKYLTNSESSRLNRSIATIIRQQRHLAARVIIATQEPTVIPATILDLSSFIICHRFSSPSWCSHLSRHVSTGDKDWFQDVMNLATGDGIVFSSTARMSAALMALGTQALRITVRPRLTSDGGASILAADAPAPQFSTATTTGAAPAPTHTAVSPPPRPRNLDHVPVSGLDSMPSSSYSATRPMQLPVLNRDNFATKPATPLTSSRSGGGPSTSARASVLAASLDINKTTNNGAADTEDSDKEDSDAQDSDAQDSDAQDSDAQDNDAQDSDAEDSDTEDSNTEGSDSEDSDSEDSALEWNPSHSPSVASSSARVVSAPLAPLKDYTAQIELNPSLLSSVPKRARVSVFRLVTELYERAVRDGDRNLFSFDRVRVAIGCDPTSFSEAVGVAQSIGLVTYLANGDEDSFVRLMPLTGSTTASTISEPPSSPVLAPRPLKPSTVPRPSKPKTTTAGSGTRYPPLEAYLSRVRSVGQHSSKLLPKVRAVVQHLHRQWVSSGERKVILVSDSVLGESVKHLPGKLSVALSAAEAMGLITTGGHGPTLVLQLAATPPTLFSTSSPRVASGSKAATFPPVSQYLAKVRAVGQHTDQQRLRKVRALVTLLHSQWVKTGRIQPVLFSEVGQSLGNLNGKMSTISEAAQAMGVAIVAGKNPNKTVQLRRL